MEKEHSVLIIIMTVLGVFGALSTSMLYLMMKFLPIFNEVLQTFYSFPSTIFLYSMILNWIGLIFYYLIWKWKKMGIYGVVIIQILSAFLSSKMALTEYGRSLIIGYTNLSFVYPIVWILLIYLGVRSEWKHYK